MPHPALTPKRTAVITGGASGIGLALAGRLAASGLNVCIADHDEEALASAAEALAEQAANGADAILSVATDVARLESVEALRGAVLDRFGEVAVLVNNAGTGGGGNPWQNYEGWQRVLGVNLWGVIHGLQAFTQAMIDQGTPCAIVNTGSKQGITNPPGDAAYNASKAGIKSLTESLAHQLRGLEGCQVTAHLLVPGFTYTGMVKRFLKEKPPAAWLPEQVADHLLAGMERGDFYILCPDNEVTLEIDHRRIEWAAGDLTENRPALSRWHPDHEAAFAAFMAKARDASADGDQKPLVVRPDEGREYDMGRMRAVFFADGEQTGHRYSISEWRLEARTEGPGAHSHADDHVFCVLEGTLSLEIDGERTEAPRGSYALIPGGLSHDFENRGSEVCRFISINVPAGFEQMMPQLVKWFADDPLGDVDAR